MVGWLSGRELSLSKAVNWPMSWKLKSSCSERREEQSELICETWPLYTFLLGSPYIGTHNIAQGDGRCRHHISKLLLTQPKGENALPSNSQSSQQ